MQQYSNTLELCMFLHGTAENNSERDWLYFDLTTMQPCKYKKNWHNGIRVNHILSRLATLVAYSSSRVNDYYVVAETITW